MIKYADDIVTLTTIDRNNNADNLTSLELRNVTSCCLTHGLTLNLQKTKCMIITKPRANVTQPQCLEKQLFLKILGVVYQENLSWNTHVDNICKRANQRIYILKQIKRLLTNKNDLVKIYNAVILSVLEYCGPLFIGMTVTNKKKLEKIRKRSHRIICGSECECDSLAPLTSRRERQAIKLITQMMKPEHILHHLVPSVLPHSSHLAMPYCRTTRRLKSFIPYCVELYNQKREL